jgi:hypothetical protein
VIDSFRDLLGRTFSHGLSELYEELDSLPDLDPAVA